MNFQIAKQLLQKNVHLLDKQLEAASGELNNKIEELILVPTNIDLSTKFWEIYIKTLDGETSIIPFVGADVNIEAIFDKYLFVEKGIPLIHINIFNLPNNLEIIKDI